MSRHQPDLHARSRIDGKHSSRSRRSLEEVPGAIVAGGAGFLGSHLCDRLIDNGYRVYCVDNFHTGLRKNVAHLEREPRFVLMEHDVRERFPAPIDVVEIYNLACPASPPHYQKDPVQTATTSVNGTLQLLALARQLNCRFLLASTSEIYGDPEVHPQPEIYCGSVNPIGPRACYDESKRMAETFCYDFKRLHNLDVRVARIFNTYGPRMRLDDGRIISNLVAQALLGEPLTIYGTGRQTRSFCFVTDMIEGLVRLMRAPGPLGGPINLGNPEEFTILEVARRVSQLTGRSSELRHLPLPKDDPRRRRPDIRRAAEVLDWRPTLPLHEGLNRTIDWFAAAHPELARPRVLGGDAATRVAAPGATGTVSADV